MEYTKKIFIFIFKFVVAFGLIYYLFLKIDWNLFLSLLKKANVILIIISALLAYVGVYISVLRWDIFLKNYNFKISKLKLFSLYSIGSFLNNVLPSTIGGDVYKIIRLNQVFGDKKKEILSSVILERGSGFFSLFLVNIILIPLFYKLIISNQAFYFLEASILIVFIFILFFIKKYKILLRIEELIKKDIFLINKFCRLVTSLSDIKKSTFLINGVLYSLLFIFGIIAAQQWLLLRAFDISVNPFYILLISTATLILGIIPISLNSIGVTEGLFVFFYHLIGVPMEVSLAVVLVCRVILIITSSLGGIFYFFDSKIKY